MIRDQIEERMGVILLQIAERQRTIRAARQAEEDLVKLRAELLGLVRQYAEETEEPPKVARILGGR